MNLSDDIELALRSVKLLAKFQALPPSHQREYLKWINQAKMNTARQARITKMCQLLLKK